MKLSCRLFGHHFHHWPMDAGYGRLLAVNGKPVFECVHCGAYWFALAWCSMRLRRIDRFAPYQLADSDA